MKHENSRPDGDTRSKWARRVAKVREAVGWMLAGAAVTGSAGLLWWLRGRRRHTDDSKADGGRVRELPPVEPLRVEGVVYLEPAEIRHDDGRIEHPAIRREPRDAWLGLILSILAAAAAVGGIAFVTIWNVFLAELDSGGDSASLYAPPPLASPLPPEPRLDPLLTEEPEVREPTPYGEHAMRRLHRYGPTDDTEFVHIPIEKAMELTAGNLPVRESPFEPEAYDQGLVGGGESNAGRLFQDLPAWLKTARDAGRDGSDEAERTEGTRGVTKRDGS